MKITTLNHVWSQCERKDIPKLKEFLFIEKTYYQPSRFRSIRKNYTKFLVDRSGKFLTGFIPKIKEKLGEVSVDSSSVVPSLLQDSRVNIDLERINLRPEQVEALDAIFKYQRGVIHLPTGSGKTLIFLSLIQELPPKTEVLIVVHTQDLLTQTFQRANEMFPGEVGTVGGGEVNLKRVNIGMIQTLYKLNIKEAFKNLDVVIVDEAHHIGSMKGTYAQVLEQLPNTPMRLGFTGTLPYTSEGKMALEGYIGPVIFSKSIQEVKSLAKPKIILKKVPYSQDVNELRTYSDVYNLGVVFNSRRNRMILDDAQEDVNAGRTVLILVTKIQHGLNILNLAKSRCPFNIDFVYGKTAKDVRAQIKADLEGKLVPVVIADAVWREGIDIPSLGTVINAAGGKSEIMTIQAIGRGLRKVEGKDEVIIRDYFDNSHRYLISHFGERVCLYFDQGWI